MRKRLLALTLLALGLGMMPGSGQVTTEAPAASPAAERRAEENPSSRLLLREPLDLTDAVAPGAVPPAPPERSPEPPPAPKLDRPPGGVTGVAVPRELGRDYVVAPGQDKAPAGRATHRVTVEVEDGLPVNAAEFAEFVMTTLNHDKSWAKDGAVTFERAPNGADFRVLLASPATVDRECHPLRTNGKWSCGRNGKAVINADRWINGAEEFMGAGGDIVAYRRYLVNHEVGHLLGQPHVGCPAPGEVAPVMMQQSLGLGECEPNGWVYP